MERAGDDSKTIRSVENAVAILDELHRCERAGVTELAEAVGLSKATVHHYLTTLREQGFVERTGEGYRLGLGALTYGGAARERERVFRIGKESVDQLAQATGETTRLVVERQGYGITLYHSNPREDEGTRTHLGTREDLHSTAAGKAMLSAMSGEQLADVLDGGLARHTENTIVDMDELRTELEEIGARAVAFDDEELFEGVRCVATPLATDQEVLGAISVSGPVERIDEETFRTTIPQELQNVAGVVTIDTTYHDWLDN